MNGRAVVGAGRTVRRLEYRRARRLTRQWLAGEATVVLAAQYGLTREEVWQEVRRVNRTEPEMVKRTTDNYITRKAGTLPF